MAYGARLRDWVIPCGLLLLAGCQDIWLNNISPLGGNTPGGRGAVDVIFVNETPYRAIFTFGTYDPLDQNSTPGFAQFVVDPDEDETVFNRGLDPGSVTARGTFLVNCGRVVSLGDDGLIAQINATEARPFNNAPIVDGTLRSGIYFTSAPIDDPDANALENYDIRSDPVLSLLGVDYSCDALLVYTFSLDPNDAGKVNVALEVIDAEQ